MAYKTTDELNKLYKNTQKKSASKSTGSVYNSKTKTQVPKDRSGNSGVRASMTNMGLDNSKIGWKDGYVTYQNLKFKPANVEDGVSYAPVSDIQSFVNSVYKTQGINPVRVTDYAAPAGMAGVSYSQNGVRISRSYIWTETVRL